MFFSTSLQSKASCYTVILISNPLSLYKAILDLTFQLFPLRTREQIFLHGWIACHTHHQGCKELTNALQKICAPLQDSGNFVVASPVPLMMVISGLLFKQTIPLLIFKKKLRPGNLDFMKTATNDGGICAFFFQT